VKARQRAGDGANDENHDNHENDEPTTHYKHRLEANAFAA
jgi:hypothetical protein